MNEPKKPSNELSATQLSEPRGIEDSGNDDGSKPAGYRKAGDGCNDDGAKPAGYRTAGDGAKGDRA